MSDKADLLIRNATVADGSGAAVFEADVAINDGAIAEIGKLTGKTGKEEIDARGLLLTPGFVDIHTHYDGQAVWDSNLASSSWHGVTTVVMGNCGVGFAPVHKEDRQRLIELMEGVEDIPGSVLCEGLKWNWQSFGDYLAVLESRPRDMDVGAQLPHAALRLFVMGERAVGLEPATDADIATMRKLAAEAMRAGAIGFSTSRTLNHRASTGDHIFSLRASENELTGIAIGMRDAGSGVIEFISDWDTPDLETEFAMVRRVVEKSGRPLSFSLSQRHATPNVWRQLLDLLRQAVADGLPIKGQVAPRAIAVLMGLQGTRNPFSNFPSYSAIAHKSFAERLAIMREPSFRAKVLGESRVDSGDPIARRLESLDMIFPLGNPPNYKPTRADSLAGEAERTGRKSIEVAYDRLLENDGRNFLFAPVANYEAHSLEVCREMLLDENTLIGLGDGGAHVNFISDASNFTFLLSYWGRDRGADRLELPWLIKRQSLDNARAVGLNDRGLIAPGMKADLNVIDFDRLKVEQPIIVADLPAGGSRLLQKAAGYVATIVSGAVTYRNGEATGALPGRLVRGPQSAAIRQ
jgi:N-acyl-D-aspartate/D-glutamate deacylase